jgi:hypothetical protein
MPWDNRRHPMDSGETLGPYRILEFIDRMRSDVAVQRQRAMARGLLDVTGVLASAQ